MRHRSRLLGAALVVALAASPAAGAARSAVAPVGPPGADDAVVIAVVDGKLNPYHWEFRAAGMPQAQAGAALPLQRPPHEWLPGFPQPGALGGYRALPLTLPGDPDALVADLVDADADTWGALEPSSATSAQLHWIPGTKVVGVLDFGVNKVRGSNADHGTRVAASAVGNAAGACPECLLVFLSFTTEAQAEAAIGWAMAQPWIDAVVNSYGFSSSGRYRDRIYRGADVAAQRAASERGQTIFFSAGNGLENDFVLPNTTLLSSQEGPDWIVTVGATAPDGRSYSGAGKPVDVSAPGAGYPSTGGTTVTGTGTFGGTSNATPVVGGLYGRALHRARTALAGQPGDASVRVQEGGIVARGAPIACGPTRPACELGDGVLTAAELRTRLLHAAVRTPEGWTADGRHPPATTEEMELVAEGHGTLWGRMGPLGGPGGALDAETERVVGPLVGSTAAPARPPGEAEWFVVDSACRQSLWGRWGDGAWRHGDPLPLPSPLWPLRTALTGACTGLSVGAGAPR